MDVKALSYSALFRTTGDKNRSALRPPTGHADHNPYIRFVSGTIKEAAIVKDRFGRLRTTRAVAIIHNRMSSRERSAPNAVDPNLIPAAAGQGRAHWMIDGEEISGSYARKIARCSKLFMILYELPEFIRTRFPRYVS